jgi:hypothetical protein
MPLETETSRKGPKTAISLSAATDSPGVRVSSVGGKLARLIEAAKAESANNNITG